MKYSRIYNINYDEELESCEKKLDYLYNKYKYVRVIMVGLNEVKIEYK